jgi:hypothetical protein
MNDDTSIGTDSREHPSEPELRANEHRFRDLSRFCDRCEWSTGTCRSFSCPKIRGKEEAALSQSTGVHAFGGIRYDIFDLISGQGMYAGPLQLEI